MNLKVKGKNETSFVLINDDDYNLNIELRTFAKNIKRKSLVSLALSFPY
jgi:hypothetical protein